MYAIRSYYAPKTEPVPPTLTDDTKKGGMFDEAISAMEGQLADLQRLEDMLSEEPDIPHEEFVPLEEELDVITSYSIHYTKLYESDRGESKVLSGSCLSHLIDT